MKMICVITEICLYNHRYKFSSEKEQVNESPSSTVSCPGLGSDPPIRSDQEWGVTVEWYQSLGLGVFGRAYV